MRSLLFTELAGINLNNKDMNTNDLSEKNKGNAVLPLVSNRFSFEKLIFKKAFPNEEYDADSFYDWAAENSNKAFDLSIEVARDLGF